MKREKISETIGNIAPGYIDEATAYKGAAPRFSGKAWRKWGLAAACFALVLAIGFPFAKDLLMTSDHKDIVDSVMLIEYDGAYWEILEDPDSLEKCGLKKEITGEQIGAHIAYLRKDAHDARHSDYIVSDEKNHTELLAYAPAPFQAVRIFRDGDKYSYALFCNYLVKQNESLPIQDAFAVYGIDGAEDIVSITPVKSDNTWKANGKAITENGRIAAFMDQISVLPAYSFDACHELVYAEELKEQEGTGGDVGSEIYTRFADDRKDIVIETQDGLRFALEYYPSYGWIYASGTMSWYQMSPEVSNWFSDSVG